MLLQGSGLREDGCGRGGSGECGDERRAASVKIALVPGMHHDRLREIVAQCQARSGLNGFIPQSDEARGEVCVIENVGVIRLLGQP